ncbi:MAG: AAA family ATPase, partial [Pseudonocardiaceae bacterium]
MRITRLYLQNYRVYEDPLDLEIPPGLVGIYGLNGAGKSSLIESIRWVLYGRSRTSVDEVRTSGVNADCLTEAEFEHEGHLYMVRRAITGINSTVRAQAFADGLQVAEGVRDTSRYVHSVLGMDDGAFRASVFAEQKQLAAFSSQTPADRRKLVLQLLGITPLDGARDAVRRDARRQAQQYEQVRNVLPDLEVVRASVAETEASALIAQERAETDEKLAAEAVTAEAEARNHLQDLEALSRRQERLSGDLRSTEAEARRAASSAARLAAEVADLTQLAGRIEVLAQQGARWRETEGLLRLVEAADAAAAALASLPLPAQPVLPDEVGWELTRTAGEDARSALAGVAASYDAVLMERDRVAAAMERSASLTGEAVCPVCGQALGNAAAAVKAHRAAEFSQIEGRVLDLELDRRRAAKAATEANQLALDRGRQFKAAQQEWAANEKVANRRAEAERILRLATEALGRWPRPGERVELAAEVERRRRAADECARAEGKLDRRPAAVAELDVERAALAEAEATRSHLRAEMAELGLRPEELLAARIAADGARAQGALALGRAQASWVAAGQAATRVEAARLRLGEVGEEHEKLAVLGDDARHLARLGDMLNSFRNTLVASVGPRLSTQAAELFAELTDHDYDALEVDP